MTTKRRRGSLVALSSFNCRRASFLYRVLLLDSCKRTAQVTPTKSWERRSLEGARRATKISSGDQQVCVHDVYDGNLDVRTQECQERGLHQDDKHEKTGNVGVCGRAKGRGWMCGW